MRYQLSIFQTDISEAEKKRIEEIWEAVENNIKLQNNKEKAPRV